jgi:hypothetical protein
MKPTISIGAIAIAFTACTMHPATPREHTMPLPVDSVCITPPQNTLQLSSRVIVETEHGAYAVRTASLVAPGHRWVQVPSTK